MFEVFFPLCFHGNIYFPIRVDDSNMFVRHSKLLRVKSFCTAQDLLLTPLNGSQVVVISKCCDALNSLKALESLFPSRNDLFPLSFGAAPLDF